VCNSGFSLVTGYSKRRLSFLLRRRERKAPIINAMAARGPITTPAIHALFEDGEELRGDELVDADSEGETEVLELADVNVDEVADEDEDWVGDVDDEVLEEVLEEVPEDSVEDVSVTAACILLTTEAAIVAPLFLACWP